MITALAVLATIGILLVVQWAWSVVDMRFVAVCWVSLVAIAWVWVAQQYYAQTVILRQLLGRRDTLQSQHVKNNELTGETKSEIYTRYISPRFTIDRSR